MRRNLILLSALTLATLGSTATQAAPHGDYVAALTTPLAAPRQAIVGGLLWKCAGEHCAAPTDGSRPVLVCQRVAKTFGPVAQFTAPGGPLSREDLSRCNGEN